MPRKPIPTEDEVEQTMLHVVNRHHDSVILQQQESRNESRTMDTTAKICTAIVLSAMLFGITFASFTILRVADGWRFFVSCYLVTFCAGFVGYRIGHSSAVDPEGGADRG